MPLGKTLTEIPHFGVAIGMYLMENYSDSPSDEYLRHYLASPRIYDVTRWEVIFCLFGFPAFLCFRTIGLISNNGIWFRYPELTVK